MRTKTALRFAGGYGLSVAISGVVSLAVIPAIIVAAGADAWATIAVAQAVAGFAFVFAVYGWGVVGPTEVAQSHRRPSWRVLLRLAAQPSLAVPRRSCPSRS